MPLTSGEQLFRSVTFDPAWLPGLAELQRAFLEAEADDVDVWQNAVELPLLRQWGLTHTTLRILVKEGILLQAEEIGRSANGRRRFRPVAILGMPERSCFVFTDEGLTWFAARRVNGHVVPPSSSVAGEEEVPHWIKTDGVVWYLGQVVMRYEHAASLQFRVLDCLQQNHWNDLPARAFRTKGTRGRRQLDNLVRGLNAHCVSDLIHFGAWAGGIRCYRGNGNGKGGQHRSRKPR